MPINPSIVFIPLSMSKTCRRALLASLTVIALLSVLIGSLFMGKIFEGKPLFFVLFWSGCFISVFLICLLALLDIRAVRKEFRERQAELDEELANIIVDAKKSKSDN